MPFSCDEPFLTKHVSPSCKLVLFWAHKNVIWRLTYCFMSNVVIIVPLGLLCETFGVRDTATSNFLLCVQRTFNTFSQTGKVSNYDRLNSYVRVVTISLCLYRQVASLVIYLYLHSTLHILHSCSEQVKLIPVRSTSFPNYSQWFTCVPGSHRWSDTISLISRDKWLPPSLPPFLPLVQIKPCSSAIYRRAQFYCTWCCTGCS